MPDRPAARFLAALTAGDDPSATQPTVVVAAHPDDETVSLGAQLARLRQATLITVTDGAPRDLRDARAHGFATTADYAAARRRELAAAMALAGLGPERMTMLGLADQAASLELAPLARRLAAALDGAAIAVTHPYEGGHPDHDATAFAVHAARALLERAGRPAPDIVEATSYHNRDGRLAAGAFLPPPTPTLPRDAGEGDRRESVDGWRSAARCGSVHREFVFDLSAAQQDLKRRMVGCFATQQAVLSQFPLDRERLRPAPAYRFTAPPHAGVLLYDLFDWGMRGARWRALAAAALRALELAEPL